MSLPFDLRQLNSFVTVAKCGSFSKASITLSTAQPALSRQVRLMEESLQVKLFVRHGRGVVLTTAGELLKQKAKQILEDVDSAASAVSSVAGEVTGQVIFGLIPSVAHSLSGDIIQQFREKYPKVSLVVEEAMSGTLQALTEQKQINLAITYKPYQRRNLQCTPLMEEQLYLIGPANSPIAKFSQIKLQDALEYTLALPSRNHGLRQAIEDAASAKKLKVKLYIEVNTLPLQIDMVHRGLAHTVLPLATVQKHVNLGEMTACAIIYPKLTRKLVLATPADKPTSMASMMLQQLVEQEVNNKISQGHWPGASHW
jgi:LysR family nitrogen assimilation transcriptional regulator